MAKPDRKEGDEERTPSEGVEAGGDVVDRFVKALRAAADLGREVEGVEEALARYEGRALKRVLVELRPIMPYIDRPIRMAEPTFTGDVPAEGAYYREPGIVLVNTFESTVGEPMRLTRLGYSGYLLIYTRAGKLVRITRRGVASADGSERYWSSDAEEVPLTAELARRHLEQCLQGIVRALERGADQARSHRDEIKARLSKLRKIVRLLAERSA